MEITSQTITVPWWEKMLGALMGGFMLMILALFLLGFPIGWYICSYSQAQMLSPKAALVLGGLSWLIVGTATIWGGCRGYRRGLRQGVL